MMEVNYLAVGLAALAAFFVGFLWYTVIFAKPWQELIGMGSKGSGKASTSETPNLGRLLAGSLLLEIIMAFVLASYIGTGADAMTGLSYGLTVGLGWVALAFGVNYMFEGKPFKLWLINAGYNTVVFAVMGLIIGAM
ncbi:MAG: DUF1761 domain-containing protein [Anaerolineales bacterium]|nr:DUF1761 domain-containing protein [Anaerolineales bacterium]MCW5855276.1 DUF1761 domain-containing protein [Anaerolineales bacterium]